jgi:hypothetical protein
MALVAGDDTTSKILRLFLRKAVQHICLRYSSAGLAVRAFLLLVPKFPQNDEASRFP